MNTFKTAVVLATLVGVGYGVHVVLNKPLPHGQHAGLGEWDEIPKIDYDTMEPPAVSTPEEIAPPPLESGAGAMIESSPAPVQGDDAAAEATAAPGSSPDYLQAGAAVPVPDGAASAIASSDVPPWNVDPATVPEPDATPIAAAAATPDAAVEAPTSSAASSASPAADAAAVEAAAGTAPPAGAESAAPADAAAASATPPADAAVPAAANAAGGHAGFEAVWQSAQSKLAAGQYADGLLTLTQVYHDTTISIQDRDRLITLLDQLAGTVIYSREHHLVPQFTAEGGETLAEVASKFNVPAEFLARVNGIPVTSALPAGQELKVVQGPFRAELDLRRRQLTLFLGQYYAGRFSVGVGRDLPDTVSQMEVIEKTGPRAFRDLQTQHEIAAGAPDNPYGDHWIGLRDPQQPTNTALGIHAWGAAVDAADTRGCISVDAQGADDLKAILSIGSVVSVVR